MCECQCEFLLFGFSLRFCLWFCFDWFFLWFNFLLWFLFKFLLNFLLCFLFYFSLLIWSFFCRRVVLFFLSTILINCVLIKMDVHKLSNLNESHLVLTFVKKGKIRLNKTVYFLKLFNSRQLNDNCF